MTKCGQEFRGGVRQTDATAIEALQAVAWRTPRRAVADIEWRRRRHRRERAIARLSAANAALTAANNELAAFAYSAAHELRAPLRAIDGFSRLLLEGYGDKLDAEGRRRIGVVCDGARTMSLLIDDILVLCRIGHQEMTVDAVDMAALVARVLTAPPFTTLGGDRIAIDIGRLPRVPGDRRLLQHVWLNLLDNAIHFTAGKPDGRIEVGGSASDGEIVYEVRDNGVGFDMRHADRLFGAFQRLHGDEYFGSGLGLAIVKRIVERHNGRVWAEGTPGEGATFRFALPA